MALKETVRAEPVEACSRIMRDAKSASAASVFVRLCPSTAFIGVNANGEIGWQRLGYGKKPGERLVRIWDWVKSPVASVNNLESK